MSELIANRYRVDRPLDVDAAAFQAFDIQLSRTVVVKTLPGHRLTEAQFAAQFYKEATAAARLTHPNIVNVYDVCENGAHAVAGKSNGPDPFMVIEWIPGDDIKAYLSSREPLPSEEVTDRFERKLDFLIQLCRGLHHGHEQDLIHGSINPENIRVTPAGEAKILNFGIAPVGKITCRDYRSPEQLQGRTKLDRRSDLFSLGVILYELLFGAHPFRADTEETTISRIVAGEYRPVDDIFPQGPGELVDIVKRLLARDPDARFPDCKVLESRLRTFRNRLSEEKEECRARLVSLRAALQKDSRSQHPAQARLFDLTVLESADPNSEDYEHLLRSCNELGAVSERLKRHTQIEKMVDSAEAEANAGEFDAAFALLADVLRADPGNERARSLDAIARRRKEVTGLLQEARQAEAAGDAGLACILALQAMQHDPDAWDAKAEFERMQAILRQRKELGPARRKNEVPPPAIRSREAISPVLTQARKGGSRLLSLGAPIVGLLLLLGIGWVIFTRDAAGPSPVSARNVVERAKPEAPGQGLVSLDVVPWAKVDSIVDLKNGKSVDHEDLESPCTFRLPAGRYAVTVSHPEFGSRRLRLEVRNGVTNNVRLSLLSKPQLEKEVQLGGR